MLRGFGTLVALCMLLLPPCSARADYVLDPADLPSNFRCDEDRDGQRCAEESRGEGWWSRYHERYDYWYHALLFDTGAYFGSGAPGVAPSGEEGDTETGGLGDETPNLVDAVYQVALRRYDKGWAFAIDMDCRQPSPGCAPKLRMVSFKPQEKIDKAQAGDIKDLLPTSVAEVVRLLRVVADWREADLRSCKGAMAHLLAFPPQKGGAFWHPRYVRWLRGDEPSPSDEIIVTTDGSGVHLRARSQGDPEDAAMAVGGGSVIYDEWNQGEGYLWARKMAEIVEPCLVPSMAPPPWEKALEPNNAAGKRLDAN